MHFSADRFEKTDKMRLFSHSFSLQIIHCRCNRHRFIMCLCFCNRPNFQFPADNHAFKVGLYKWQKLLLAKICDKNSEQKLVLTNENYFVCAFGRYPR